MARIFERLFPLCLWPGIDGIKRVENRIYACQQFAIQSGFEVKRSSTTGSDRPDSGRFQVRENKSPFLLSTLRESAGYPVTTQDRFRSVANLYRAGVIPAGFLTPFRDGLRRHSQATKLCLAHINQSPFSLRSNGVDPSRLQTFGAGSSSPIAPNDTAEGRAQNRRVEIKLVPRSGAVAQG